MIVLLVILALLASVWLGWELRDGYTRLPPPEPDNKDNTTHDMA